MDTYTVIEQPREDIPVYRIRSQAGMERTIHRNHLYPIEHGDDRRQYVSVEDISGLVDGHVKADPKDSQKVDGGDIDMLVENKVDSDVMDKVCDSNGHVKECDQGNRDDEDDDDDDDCVLCTHDSRKAHKYEAKKSCLGSLNKHQDAHPKPKPRVSVKSGTSTNFQGQGSQTDNQVQPLVDIIANHRDALENRGSASEVQVDVHAGLGTDDIEQMSESEIQAQPKPLPRKSTRIIKPPVRYRDYQISQMVLRPRNYKVHALEVMVSSGVLDELDSDVVNSIVKAVMQ
ncbi:hypothetical protein DPMN_153959 [Dreissena polymorpha]|uniref:Uncharacterized protein n=1 Tax=Dreissena polymorpha TaxID=45954 RepID=A0A9D4FLQ5_DREPO|nr:hypothetical protein DPMN_153959 [Dreissena polymorpha]